MGPLVVIVVGKVRSRLRNTFLIIFAPSTSLPARPTHLLKIAH